MNMMSAGDPWHHGYNGNHPHDHGGSQCGRPGRLRRVRKPRPLRWQLNLEVRRRAMRNSAVSRPIGLIRPQYLPALARTRILRLRMLRTR